MRQSNIQLLIVAAVACLVAPAERVEGHCQVPCGIYGDQRRFDSMLEDTATIAKAITQIGELAGTHDANGHNQLARWVATKESHATTVQHTIADYFMAQRIKASDPEYGKKLMAAHKVMVAAMKAKQAADPATAKALEQSILDFFEAYAGKPYQAAHVH